jgi:hypothetical protein
MPRKHDAHKDDLEGVAQRLRSERPVASPLDLDRIKTTAMSRAKSATGGGRAGTRRLAVASLTVGLLAAGTGGVIAGVGSSHSSGNAAIAQYGGNCDTNNGNGTNIGSGNGNKDGNGNGNTSFAAYITPAGKGHGHSHSHSSGGNDNGVGNGNNGSGNGIGNTTGSNNENGNGNGTGNGNDNGNESGNGNNNFNCNENSFNTTENNVTNNVTNNIVNNYTTVSATPVTPASGVQGSTTSKKAKTSSRHIKIHIKVPRKAKLRRVTLKVNGKIVSVLKGKKASANINLINLPCVTGATTVSITAVTSSGKTITESHTYHLCQA